jgi:hypothetical protein
MGVAPGPVSAARDERRRPCARRPPGTRRRRQPRRAPAALARHARGAGGDPAGRDVARGPHRSRGLREPAARLHRGDGIARRPDAPQQRFELLRAAGRPLRRPAAARRRRPPPLHRAPGRHSALHEGAHRADARRPGHRLHRAAGRARRTRPAAGGDRRRDRSGGHAVLAPVHGVPGRRRGGGADGVAGRGAPRDRRTGGARVWRAAGVHARRLRARRAAHDGRLRPARRRRVLRRTDPPLHDAAPERRRGARARPARSRAHPGRDAPGQGRRGLRRRPGRLPAVPAHRRPVLRPHAAGAACAGLVDLQAHRRPVAQILRRAAAPALWRRAGARRHRAVLHHGPLRARAAADRLRRHVLGQHARAGVAPALHAGGADAARGRAGPSPADRAGGRTHRPAAVPAPRLRRRLWRGLGAVRRAPGRRDGRVPDPV